MITLRKRLPIQSTNIWLLALRQPGFSKLRRAHHSRIKYDCLNGNNVTCHYNFVWKPSCDSWTVGSIKPSQNLLPLHKHIYSTVPELGLLCGLVSHETNWSTGEWLQIETNVTRLSRRTSVRKAPSLCLFLFPFLSKRSHLSVHKLTWALRRTIYRLSDVSPLTFYTSSPFHHSLLTGQDHAARFTSIHGRRVDGRYQSQQTAATSSRELLILQHEGLQTYPGLLSEDKFNFGWKGKC